MKDTAYLIDSAAYIDLMRAGQDPRQVLAPLLRAGRLYNCGIVRAEVLRGIKIEKAYRQMEQFFDIVPEVPSDPRLWRDVSQLGYDLGDIAWHRFDAGRPQGELAAEIAALVQA